MSRLVNLNSLPFRLALFFAANPDEQLDTSDVAVKFDVPETDVHHRLTHGVRMDIFARTANGPGRGKRAVYTAGNALLMMVGGATQRAMIDACMPVQRSVVIEIKLPLIGVATTRPGDQ